MKPEKTAPVLAITPNEQIFLPKCYHRIQDICAVIYDQLTEIYKEKNYQDLYHTESILDGSETGMDELNKNKIHAIDWLTWNNKNKDLELILTKHIILSITSDFINFVFESLYCAKRGKITVAYALIRKPFTDELLILEQLLYNRSDFIYRFFHSDTVETYDPSSKNINKVDVIKNAVDCLTNPLFDADFVHDLRYNKLCEYGINGISNHALHIVTKNKNYRTEPQNFNFVFSQEEDFALYYKQYYWVVPYILIYAVDIIDKLIFSILKDTDNQNLSIVKRLRRTIGFSLFTESYLRTKKYSIFILFNKKIRFTCPICKNKYFLKRDDYEFFFETEAILCPKCNNDNLTIENIQKIKNIIGL